MHRAARVDQDGERDTGLARRGPDVKLAQPGIDVPVDAADVVAGHVPPVVDELEAGRSARALALTAEAREHGVERVETEPAEDARSSARVRRGAVAVTGRATACAVECFCDHVSACDAVAFGVEVEDQTVAQDGHRDRVDVLDGEVMASFQQRRHATGDT